MNTLVVLLFFGQIGIPGGQSPGQYPPGQYPPGSQGPGIPMPGRSRKTTSTQKKEAETPTTLVTGVVTQIDGKSMEVKAEDTRIINFAITDKTARPKDLAVGYTVDVTAKEDEKGYFTADTIRVTKTESAAATTDVQGVDPDAPAPSGSTTLKGAKYDSGDDGPPKLKRGKPAQRPGKSDADETEVASAAKPETVTAGNNPTLSLAHPAPPRPVVVQNQNPRLALIDRAREEAANFIQALPNYVCQENTTRYVSEGQVSDWHALDVVSVEVVYEGGKEEYRNIQINGKATKKPLEDTGAWSTGEFGTILVDIFHPSTAADFHYVKDATLSSFATSLYDFSVQRERSHWHVKMSGQSVYPSYKGSIWIDKKSARVIRIEMQATNIPAEFPADTVESAVDYNYISLGAVDKFFLPTHAEILSCQRGTNSCGKNVIDFRNYHRFTGETKIIFDK